MVQILWMGFKLSVFLKVNSTAMHDTEWESGIQNSEQLKAQKFCPQLNKVQPWKEGSKKSMSSRRIWHTFYHLELLFPLFKEENFLNYLFVRHVRSSTKRRCISNSDCVCPTFKFSSNPIIEFHFFTCIGNFKFICPGLSFMSPLLYQPKMALIHCTCF